MTVSLLKNASWGGLGELSARLAKIAQVMVLVRWLGAEQFGRFNHAAALVGLFAVFFDLGIATIAVREIARQPANNFVLQEFGVLKLMSSAVGLFSLTIWVICTVPTGAERWLILYMGLYLWLIDLGSYVFVVYRAGQQFWKETAVRSVTSVLQLAACVIAIRLWGRVVEVVAALACSAGLAVIPLLVELSRRGPYRPTPTGNLTRRLKECLPVACTALVATVYINYDIVILAKHASMQEVGWYSVAVKTIFGIFILPIHFFSLASLPALSARSSAVEAAELRLRWLGYFARTTFVGATLALSVGILAAPLLQVAFGRQFLPAAPILFMFVLPCFFFYLYTPLAQWVLLQHQQARSMAVSIGAALLNVLLVLWWVPLLGMWGAAFAAVVTHAALALGNLRLVFHSSGFSGREPGWNQVFRSTLGLGLAWLVVRYAPWPPIAGGLAALGVFILLTRKQWITLVGYAPVFFRQRAAS